MRTLLSILALLSASSAGADTLVAAQAIPGRTTITEAHVVIVDRDTPGALVSPDQAVGLEARVTLYPGRPIRPGDLGPPAIFNRNDLASIRYRAGPLTIETEGRVLDRAGIGDRVRVMNLSSRTIVTGRVTSSGTIEVGS